MTRFAENAQHILSSFLSPDLVTAKPLLATTGGVSRASEMAMCSRCAAILITDLTAFCVDAGATVAMSCR